MRIGDVPTEDALDALLIAAIGDGRESPGKSPPRKHRRLYTSPVTVTAAAVHHTGARAGAGAGAGDKGVSTAPTDMDADSSYDYELSSLSPGAVAKERAHCRVTLRDAVPVLQLPDEALVAPTSVAGALAGSLVSASARRKPKPSALSQVRLNLAHAPRGRGAFFSPVLATSDCHGHVYAQGHTQAPVPALSTSPCDDDFAFPFVPSPFSSRPGSNRGSECQLDVGGGV